MIGNFTNGRSIAYDIVEILFRAWPMAKAERTRSGCLGCMSAKVESMRIAVPPSHWVFVAPEPESMPTTLCSLTTIRVSNAGHFSFPPLCLSWRNFGLGFYPRNMT